MAPHSTTRRSTRIQRVTSRWDDDDLWERLVGDTSEFAAVVGRTDR
jgi:hypothetical protein